jgi:hypothetical protein
MNKKCNHNNKHKTKSYISYEYATIYELQNKHELSIQKYEEPRYYLIEFNKQENKNVENTFLKTLELEDQIEKEKDIVIKDQRRILGLTIIGLFLSIILILIIIIFIRKNRVKSVKINRLNISLGEIILDLKSKNEDLFNSKKEIEKLLKFNEETLLSRAFKIAKYNESIQKITENMKNYMNTTSTTKYLNGIHRKLKGLISEEELWEDFKIQFEKIKPEFFTKLKNIAPNLSVNDLKHCTYIISNLKSKEVGELLNVSSKSVETTRYRIRKKIGVDTNKDFYTLLNSL